MVKANQEITNFILATKLGLLFNFFLAKLNFGYIL